MVIQHNMHAMFSERQLGITTRDKAKSQEKLSSGYKINRAADNAAGLAISEKMRKKVRGLHRGAENIQDGISLVQVADGALHETHDMLQRMNELAIQAANGTNSESDRHAIQQEINQLKMEIDRVSETTSFNQEIFPLMANEVEKSIPDDIDEPDLPIIEKKPRIIDDSLPNYKDEAGYIHIVLGSGVYSLENITGCIIDVSGDVSIKDTHLENAMINCAEGTRLSIENVTIDNSMNIGPTGMGVGTALKFTGSGNVLNCYGNNEFNGGMDHNFQTFIEHSSYGGKTGPVNGRGCAGINVGEGSQLTINGTSTSRLTAHGFDPFPYKYEMPSYVTWGYAGSAPAIGSNELETGGTIIINSGNIFAYSTIDELHGSFGEGCIGGGTNTNVVINGGKVFAQGGTYYGIGGGGFDNSIDNSSVIINGGEVYSESANASPAIGFIGSGSVEINGGTVTAKGTGYQSVGIGGVWAPTADNTNTGIISIRGGTILAVAEGGRGYGIGYYDINQEVGDMQYFTETITIDISGGDLTSKTKNTKDQAAIDYISELGKTTKTYIDGVQTNTHGILDDENYNVYGFRKHTSVPDEPSSLTGGVDDTSLVSVKGNKEIFDEDEKKQERSDFNSGNGALSTKRHRNWLKIQNSDEAADWTSIHTVDASCKGIGVQDVNVLSADLATGSIDMIAAGIKKVSEYRSYFGAMQNRFEHARSINLNTEENTTAAESRIRDTDIPKEMVRYSKSSILEQAGQSMLAQANQSTNGIMSLLQ